MYLNNFIGFNLQSLNSTFNYLDKLKIKIIINMFDSTSPYLNMEYLNI